MVGAQIIVRLWWDEYTASRMDLVQLVDHGDLTRAQAGQWCRGWHVGDLGADPGSDPPGLPRNRTVAVATGPRFPAPSTAFTATTADDACSKPRSRTASRRDLGFGASSSAVVGREGRGRRREPRTGGPLLGLGKPGGVLPGSAPRSPTCQPRHRSRLGHGGDRRDDELDKVHPRSGVFIPPRPHRIISPTTLGCGRRRISLHAARNEFVAFQVLIQGRRLGRDVDLWPELVFSGQAGGTIQVTRHYPLWVCRARAGPLPDPILPLPATAPATTKLVIYTIRCKSRNIKEL